MQASMVIFAELLVAGIQAMVWLALLVGLVLDLDSLSFDWVNGREIPLGIVALAFAYSIGVLADRLADRLFDRRDKRLRAKAMRESAPDFAEWRLEVLARNADLAADLAYTRSRSRIARATAVNVLLITVTATAFVLIRTSLVSEPGDWIRLGAMVLLGLGISLFAYWGWFATSRTQYIQLTRMRLLLREQGGGLKG